MHKILNRKSVILKSAVLYHNRRSSKIKTLHLLMYGAVYYQTCGSLPGPRYYTQSARDVISIPIRANSDLHVAQYSVHR